MIILGQFATKIFFSFITNVRLLKDKLVTKIFTTTFQKVKLKPGFRPRLQHQTVHNLFFLIWIHSM